MEKQKKRCVVCGCDVEEDDLVYAIKGERKTRFHVCGRHGINVARFLEGSGLAERTFVPGFDLWNDDRWGRDERPKV